MILPWNRKEVFMGSSMTDFCKARDILLENHLEYGYRIVDRSARGQSFGRTPALTRLAAPCGNPQPNVTYYLYVLKENFETTKSLLKSNVNS